MQNRLRWRVGVLAPWCLLFSGCVTRSASDAGASFHYQWWLPIGLFVAGVVFVPIGWFVRRHSGRIGWGLIIAGPVAALAFAPSLLMERVFVHDRGFEVRSGIWGMTANETVNFDGVQSLRIAQEETGGRNSRMIEVLYFDMKAGPGVRLPLNNDVKIEAGKEIAVRAAQRGIPLGGVR
jgi:hypothetical protein